MSTIQKYKNMIYPKIMDRSHFYFIFYFLFLKSAHWFSEYKE